VAGGRELEYDQSPRLPVPLQRFMVAAADKGTPFKRLERPRNERGVLSVCLRVMDIDVGDYICGHLFSLSSPGSASATLTPRKTVPRSPASHADRVAATPFTIAHPRIVQRAGQAIVGLVQHRGLRVARLGWRRSDDLSYLSVRGPLDAYRQFQRA
jgi:hypothetical protein